MLRSRLLIGQLFLSCLVLPGIWQLAFSQSNPEHSINLSHIETSIQQGKIALVEKRLFDYAISHPKDVRALELLGQVRFQQNRLEEALALYQRVVALDPSLVKAKINVGLLMYELGQHESARLLLGDIAATSAVKVNEQLALAKALVRVGEFQKALAVTAKLPTASKSSTALPVRAAAHLGLGDRQSLVALVPSIRKAAISDAEVATECAEVFRKAGMHQEAVGLLRLALARAPNNFRLLVLLGQMETQSGNLAEARQYLDRAAKLKPNTADGLYSLGMLESAKGNYELSLSYLKQARALAPQAIPILTQLVINAMQAKQAQMAVDFANELLQLKSDEPEFLYLFGAASLQNGSFSSAQNALERFTQQRPDDQRGCLALGISLAGQPGRQQEAKSKFEQCVKLGPANVEPKYQLGLIFKSEGEVQQAIQMLEEVTMRAPNHANALRDLGALYIQTGAEAKARIVLERAATLNSEDAETHFQLSRLYNLIGENKLARQHLGLFQKLKGQREKLSQP